MMMEDKEIMDPKLFDEIDLENWKEVTEETIAELSNGKGDDEDE